MNKKTTITTKQLVITGLMLALCIVFQSMKSLSTYLTGSAVNCIIVITTLACGMVCGGIVAVLTPLIAFVMGQTPIMKLIPAMVFVIMVGNLCMVIFPGWLKKKQLLVGLAAGSVVKALFLWLVVWYVMLPFFGTNVPEAMQTAVKTTFSVTQLITALIGSGVAWVIWLRLKHVVNK